MRNFIQACHWIRDKTDGKVVSASRKSTLSYVWTENKSIHFYDTMQYNRYTMFPREGEPPFDPAKFEQLTLDYYEKNGVNYVILDAFRFSPETQYRIKPMLQRYIPARWEVVFFTPKKEPNTFVLKLKE